MIQQPIIIQKNSIYENVNYNLYIGNTQPIHENLNFALLKANTRVSAIIDIEDSTLCEYKKAIICISFKEVFSKAKRYNKLINNRHLSNVLYRDNLDNEILNYINTSDLSNPFVETKMLLLNDLEIDKDVGDAGVQVSLIFEKYDGLHEFYLNPGSAERSLIELVGLGVLTCDNVQYVLNNIIDDLTQLLITHVLIYSRINITEDLKESIKRYLYFSFYGRID